MNDTTIGIGIPLSILMYIAITALILNRFTALSLGKVLLFSIGGQLALAMIALVLASGRGRGGVAVTFEFGIYFFAPGIYLVSFLQGLG